MQEDLIHFSPIVRLLKESALQRRRNVQWTRGRTTDSTPTARFFALKLTRAFFVVCYSTLVGCGGTLISQSAGSGSAQTQTAVINWANFHQVIDGFGAATGEGSSLSSAQHSFLFGTGPGQLGLSLLRAQITDNSEAPGDCTSVSTSCAGVYVSDMQAMIANGGRVYASPWTPPPTYKTNGDSTCLAGAGNGSLITGDYGLYATWLANFVKSLQTEDGISLYALSIQNEPDACTDYDSAVWTSSQIDTFIKTNFGPTFASDGLSTLIFMPETGLWRNMSVDNTGSGNNLGDALGTTWPARAMSAATTTTITMPILLVLIRSNRFRCQIHGPQERNTGRRRLRVCREVR